MARPEWLKKAIAAGGDFHAMKQVPWRHNTRNIATAFIILSLAAAVIAVAPYAPWWAYTPLAIFLLGCLYFSLFILVVHESSHDMFVVMSDRKRQKRWNRFFGRLGAAPFFTNYDEHWEIGHTTHHVKPCTPDDPQEDDPETGWPLLRTVLILCLVPFSVFKLNPSNQYGFNPVRALKGICALVIPSILVGWFWSWPAAIAMVAGIQVTLALTRLKRTQEHGSGLAHEPDFVLRSRTYLYRLAPLTSPLNINYHFEHHANFNVPWYLLPDYHNVMRRIVPEELQPYIFHSRYLDQAAGRFQCIPAQLREQFGIEPLPAGALSK